VRGSATQDTGSRSAAVFDGPHNDWRSAARPRGSAKRAPRALSAATSEFCGVHRRFPPSSDRCPLGTTVPASELQGQQRLPMSAEPWSETPDACNDCCLGRSQQGSEEQRSRSDARQVTTAESRSPPRRRPSRCELGSSRAASALPCVHRAAAETSTPAMTAALGAANKAAMNNAPARMPVSRDGRVSQRSSA
jgi:hypothetical protein